VDHGPGTEFLLEVYPKPAAFLGQIRPSCIGFVSVDDPAGRWRGASPPVGDRR
jgi:hypothetical protein